MVRERLDVLTVSVAALLAPIEGGYALEVVEGDRTRVVPVETGLIAGGRVEVSGPGLAEGMHVRVPA
jgi:membrane fusion protein, multidrug efflux system